jgi:uncharacterized protein (TIGR02996 family)
MNEEDAFLTAIVASPGDDTNRLVYADWLDDRDDPRGGYLRAEVARAQSRDAKDESKARRLAQPLDAVWVARVSRPPLGVCCDRVSFDHDYDFKVKSVTSAELDRLEKRFGLTLPADYRAFLLNYNGGEPKPNRLRFPDRRGEDCVTALTGVYSKVDPRPAKQSPGLDWEIDLVRCLLFLEWYRDPKRRGRDPTAAYWQTEPLRDQIIIGYSDPNGSYEIYCLGVRGAAFGKVIYAFSYQHDEYAEYNCLPVADSFAAFLALLNSRKQKKTQKRKSKKA